MSHTVRRLVRDMRSRDSRSRGDVGERGATDLRGVRLANRTLVLNCIRAQGPLARVAIARRTGLSRTTVSSIVDALLKEGLVREGSTVSAAPSGGRRATLVHFNEAAGRILGADLGRSHLTLLATDLAANIIARRSSSFDCSLGPDVCLPLLVREVRDFVASSDIEWDSVVGLGLGIPGPLDADQRMLVAPPRMPGWSGVDILRFLRQELKIPVYLGNDANMGARGESRYGAGRGLLDFAYVKVGTGIGCGLVIAGEVYRGSHGSAGEVGHVTIDEDGPLCDCGNRGCLETLASAPQIVEDALHGFSLRRMLGPDAPAFTGSRVLMERQNVDVADVVLAAQNGDAACRAAIERAGELIGVALASLINLFSPAVILLDGSVARANELVLDPIRRALAARSLPAASEGVRIIRSELGDNAIALGGVAMVIDAAFGSWDRHAAATSMNGRVAATARESGRDTHDEPSDSGRFLVSARDPPSTLGQVST